MAAAGQGIPHMKGRPVAVVALVLVTVSWVWFFPGDPLTARVGKTENPSGRESRKGVFKEIRIGVLAHDVDHLWSNMHVEDGIDWNVEILFLRPCLRLLSGTIYPNLGVTINDRGNTSKGYIGFLWEWTVRRRFFLDIGLGAALHNGELNNPVEGKKRLGCRVLFRIPFELGVRISRRLRLSLMFAHVSNGYSAEYNQGLDVLGLRLGYCFKN